MIDLSTDAGMREAFREIASWTPELEPVMPRLGADADPAERRAPARRWTLLAAAAVVALLIVGLVTVGRRSPTAPSAPVSGRWRAMTAAPIEPRLAPSSVWTGREVVIWGGYTPEGLPLTDGAAYDPGTDSWRSIAPPSIVPAPSSAPWSQASALRPVWAGGMVVSVVASQAAGPWGWDLVGYDPDADTWRTLDSNRYDQLASDELVPVAGAAPLHDVRALAEWRDLAVAIGWRSDLGHLGWATFDPQTREWSPFHPIDDLALTDDGYDLHVLQGAPTVTGDRLIVVARGAFGVGGFAVDLATGRGRGVATTFAGLRFDGSADEELAVVGVATDETGSSERVAAVLDPATLAWRTATPPPRGPAGEGLATLVAVPGGHVLLGGLAVPEATVGGLRSDSVAIAATSDVDRWASMPAAPFDVDRTGMVAVWTGRELVVWGGAAETPGGTVSRADRPLGDGGVYRPNG